jgi:hypothetical protein
MDDDDPTGRGRTVRPEVLGRDQAHTRYMAKGSLMMFEAVAEQSHGDLSLMERTLPPGGRRLRRIDMPTAPRPTSCSRARCR